jgi:DNA helicase-2/ATP-dependent DNA helicase PcrA
MVGINPRFVIYDDEDQLRLIKQAQENLGIDPKHYSPKVFQKGISKAKSHFYNPEDVEQHPYSHIDKIVSRVYKQYEGLLRENSALDFDDLIMKTVLLFQAAPSVLSYYQSRYLHILVDEFQDTSLSQYLLVKKLGGKYHNICAVGDPDQSIYSFRFADIRNIMNFERDYPDAKVIVLEQSYRSTKSILELAQNIISHNKERKEKRLWTQNESGIPSTLVEVLNPEEEGEFVASEVEKLLCQGEGLSDMAVMYRTNVQSRPIEEALVRSRIPYQLIGGMRFYQRREIKDIIAYLRVAHNPQDNLSLDRIINIPKRGIGEETRRKLFEWAREENISLYSALKVIIEGSPHPFPSRTAKALSEFFPIIQEIILHSYDLGVAELIDLVVQCTGYEDYLLAEKDGEERWENILELRSSALKYTHSDPKESLASFLQNITLSSDIDEFDEKKEAITLITLHQAKGLEFGVVFIIGVEEGILPHLKSFDDPRDIEEERRLFYVGVTRAKRKIYFLHSLLYGLGSNHSSRFIQHVPPQLMLKRFWVKL